MRESKHGHIYVFLFSLFWAIDVLITKIALKNGAAASIFTYQSLFFSVLFTSIYLLFRKRPKFEKKDILFMLGLGLLANGIGTLLSTIGLSLSTATNYGFLVNQAQYSS